MDNHDVPEPTEHDKAIAAQLFAVLGRKYAAQLLQAINEVRETTRYGDAVIVIVDGRVTRVKQGKNFE